MEKWQFFDFLNFLFLLPRKAFFRSRISQKTFSYTVLPSKKKLGKWPFLSKNHGITPLEKWQFSTFSTSCFHSLERRFFLREYRKTYFSGLYCLKKKVEKMAFFGPKPPFFTFWFFASDRRFFVLEYRKCHFPGPYCLQQRNCKNGHFSTNPWVNPFRIMAIFWRFKLFFYSLERRFFFVLEYRKTHFRGLYCLKKEVQKMANFEPKPWVNAFGKMSIFRLFELFVFWA